MPLYCGIDLHSNNQVIVVTVEEDKKLEDKRIDNDLEATLKLLSPYKKKIKAVAVELTFNWYWLVDGPLIIYFLPRICVAGVIDNDRDLLIYDSLIQDLDRSPTPEYWNDKFKEKIPEVS